MTLSMAGLFLQFCPLLNLELHDEYDHNFGTLALLGNS